MHTLGVVGTILTCVDAVSYLGSHDDQQRNLDRVIYGILVGLIWSTRGEIPHACPSATA